VPELRIVDQEVWDAAKARQKSLAYEPPTEPGENTLNERRRAEAPIHWPRQMWMLWQRLHHDF
jgi:hypothetical protein